MSGTDNTPWRVKENLEKLYIQKNLSTRDIAEKYGCHRKTITKWLKKHDIGDVDSRTPTTSEKLQRKDWLQKQYVDLGKGPTEIGRMCDRSAATVRRWLKNHDIPTRKGYDEITYPQLKDESWLRGKYIDEGSSMADIASELGCGVSTVKRYLHSHNIQTTSPDSGLSGQENPNWRGGSTGGPNYGPGWTESKRQIVRRNHGNECVDCGMESEEHSKRWGERLHIHHLCNARESTNPAVYNSPRNLIPVCRSCHASKERRFDKESGV